uniref:Uncharacterized protein n=1 Tax=Anser brachyrhynchus TaxID=132585 RepID=A0A8B9ICK0_9AVES
MRWVKKKKARIPGKQKNHTNGCRTLGRTRGLGEGSPSQKTGFGKAPGAANAPRRSLGWPTLTNARLSSRTSPDDVPHQQEEGVPGGGAEVDPYHDVGVSIEELDKFFQAPEAALQAAQEELGKLPRFGTFQPVVQVLQGDPDDLDDGEDQRPEGERAGDVPERAAEGGEEGEGGHVVRFLEGPVVRGEGACQRHLPQRDHKVGEPEEHEDVEELEDDEVLVVRRLSPIEREEALGVGAQLGDVGRVEFLGGGRRILGTVRRTDDISWSTQSHPGFQKT